MLVGACSLAGLADTVRDFFEDRLCLGKLGELPDCSLTPGNIAVADFKASLGCSELVVSNLL